MKQLLICRHAKSSWKDPELRDFDRPLNKRGKGDAPEMGRRLAAHGLQPDLIYASSAVRAVETVLHYAKEIGYPVERIQFNPGQYTASVPMLLSLIQEVDQEVATLMVVGHNPESTMLVITSYSIHYTKLYEVISKLSQKLRMSRLTEPKRQKSLSTVMVLACKSPPVKAIIRTPAPARRNNFV